MVENIRKRKDWDAELEKLILKTIKASTNLSFGVPLVDQNSDGIPSKSLKESICQYNPKEHILVSNNTESQIG